MLRPATRIGDFEVLKRLGTGSQGDVFLAHPWHDSAERRVLGRLRLGAFLRADGLTPHAAGRLQLAALKVARREAADALRDEHRHLSHPDALHPHLVRCYSRRPRNQIAGGRLTPLAPANDPAGLRSAVAGDPTVYRSDLGFVSINGKSRPYLTLAYEPGMTLERMLASRRPALYQSVMIVAQAAAALEHLHGMGIVHHDLRPANLLIYSRPWRMPRCVLIDLGAAETPGLPRRQAVYGTEFYLPPERRVEPPAPASPLVDIYAVGRLLDALTAGTPVSSALRVLVAEATAYDPTRRVQDMTTMRIRLLALPEAAPALSTLSTRSPDLPARGLLCTRQPGRHTT